MDIICDTNIWYNIGSGNIDTSTVSSTDKLIGNYNNIDEFAGTINLLYSPDKTTKAIQAMYQFSQNHFLLDPPFTHIIKLHKPNFNIDLSEHTDFMIEFTTAIANGNTFLDEQKEDEFKTICEERKQKLQNLTNVYNSEAERIRQEIKGKKIKKKADRIPSIRNLISTFASEQRGGEHLAPEYDWTKIELFENAFLDFLINLEKGAIKSTANDWYDLFLLAYVQPDKKVWTKEKKWINIINNAGMSKYLYDN